ncbi:hypothetical protein HDU98_012192 [Podochytrium sp. JEL0797]|nr:hypothetical protein HDU98_012192 [Podochytrium sp. JEL0797]
MEAQFLLKFTPEENVDYLYNLVCVTEREKFLLPIRAYGARGLMDFPDTITFSECPIRYTSTKTLFVRNIGNRPAKFGIDVASPFQAVPDSGFLEVNKSMQIDVHFNPESAGSFVKDLLVKYDTGEITRVSLSGNAEDSNIRLEKNSLRMENTYITLSSMKQIRIFNRSEKMTSFQWRMFGTSAEDRQYKLKRKLAIDKQEEIDCLAFYNQLATNQSLALCDLSPITQKYKNKRREIENDPLLVSDEFLIQPIEGTIWPNSHVDIFVVFKPLKAGTIATNVYCEGEGVGPKGRFSCDKIDVQEVFINTCHQYEIFLENRGDIGFNYSLVMPDSLFGRKFEFSPSSGVLRVGEQQQILVSFCSDILGSFAEELEWVLEGASESIFLYLSGNVIGPTFHFDAPNLDFGQISFGFPTTRKFQIVNTSLIPMDFDLKMSGGREGPENEFGIIPSRGKISPMESATIEVHFTPKTLKKYSEYLSVDVECVGENLKQLAVFAESIVPEISLVTPALDYSDCFFCYPYDADIELRNDTPFLAKYELLAQEEAAKSIYSYSSFNGSGVMHPFSTEKIRISVQIKRLGVISFPVFIRVTGNEEIPLAVDISAVGIGPNVLFSSMDLNWGKIPVLKDTCNTLTLVNESPIAANFNCSTVSEASCFSIEPTSGTIAPGGSIEIRVTAFLDDALKFTDILKVAIQNDGIYEVQLVARGHGSTITFDESLKNIEFADVFSNRECSREFTLVIVIKGYSNKSTFCKEVLACQVTLDKDPARRIVVESTVTANFINPLLQMNPPVLRFISDQIKNEDLVLLTQNLTLKNTSLLPLHLSFKCPVPYSIEPADVDCRLNPGDALAIKVSYDPRYNTNRETCKEHAKLGITYSEHPQKDYIELFSQITFPNIKFSTTEISFGCIPNNTEQRKTFVITNTSTLPVEYNWFFLEDSIKTVEGVNEQRVSISQVFDILPVRSFLMAGQSEEVEVSFYGHPNSSFSATVVCDVFGGPDYELSLKGEASIVDFAFDKTCLDFGTRLYQEILEQELTLTNTGNVAFDYNTIIFPTSTLWQKIMVSPSSGTITPHAKQKITVRFCNCVPEVVDEFFYIQIALFEPIKIRVMGHGIFPLVHMDIPRAPDAKYELAMGDAKVALAKTRRIPLPQSDKKTSLAGAEHAETAADEKLEAELEAEAERVLLREKTNKFLMNLTEEIKSKAVLVPKTKTLGSTILLSKSLQKSKDKRMNNTIHESSEVILSNYVCNSVLMGTGFSIEPDRVKLLPGKPHYESVEFQVSFQSRSQSGAGIVTLDLPIHVSGGPATVLTLQADVTLPELQVSTNDIDFGEVTCGFRKTVAVQLHNKNPVPCEWSTDVTSKSNNGFERLGTKKKTGNSVVKEFEFVPKSGILQPGEKNILSIRFSSNEEKEYDAIIPLKINSNPQPVSIHLRGRGVKPAIQFEPDLLQLGPILPCSEGAEGKFSIYNPTNFPVEIYSVEFDQHYEEEEELLRHVDGYEGNLIFLPPREPGQPLPDYLVENAKANMQKRIVPIQVTSDSSTKDAGVGDIVEVPRSNIRSPGITVPEILHDPALCIVIYGPPLSGKSLQVQKLQETFDLPSFKIDQILEALGPVLEERVIKHESTIKFDERMSIARPMNVILADDVKKQATNESDHTIDLVVAEDVLFDILRSRFQQADCSRGVIIDSLESKFVHSPVVVMKVLLRIFGDKKKVVLMNLALDLGHIKDREASQQKSGGEHEFDPMHVKDISEEEYDAMSDAERENYDIALMKYKRKLRELQDKRKNERRLLEEEMALRMGERKAEEENLKSGKKKGGAKRVTPQVPSNAKLEKALPVKSDVKNSKLEKGGTLSPKTAKKLLEKDAKDAKPGEKEKLPAEEDFNSPFSEAGDAFINEVTLKRLEAYNLTYESVLSALREADKSSTNRVILPSSATIEKKVIGKEKEKEKSLEKGKAVASAIVAEGSVAPVVQDMEAAGSEEISNATFHEIAASFDRDSVFKMILECVPAIQKPVEALDVADIIPPPYVEQIIHFPNERETRQRGKTFQLQPPSPTDNEDESKDGVDGASKCEAAPAAPPAVTIPVPVAVVAPSSTINSKRNRGAAKIAAAEEIKVVDEVIVEEEVVTKFRWIIPPEKRVDLTVKFNSTDIGKYEQSLQFEITGSRMKYSIPLIGNCRYSVISNDYKKMFPKWRKSKEEKTICHGEFVVSTGTFEFGPLLYSKPREKYLERFTENRAVLTITNPSLVQEIKLFICLKNDVKGDVFFLDPPTMDLMPGQSQTLNIWAYPRSANYFEDMLVVCVKDNPEPYCYKISCSGCKPELEIDKRQLSFDKMLLGRSERRELKLKNNTLMPVAWKLAQVELLGEEFTVSPIEGVIDPYSEQIVSADFKGTKPVVISRRSIRLEVFDTEKIGGVVQEVPIMITAEAYDIAMDLHFPKGFEGGLDFGVIKVLEEGKQVCTLKNKGKYEVGFRFLFENKDLADIFTLLPNQGIMQPSDKPFAIQVIIKATKELLIRDNASLKCQFYEPATGEVTATIPVKLQARSVFSRFSILPMRDLNFGALVHGTKVSRQFTIENQGEFDFKYSIYKIQGSNNDSRGDKKSRGGQTRTSKGPPRPISPPPQPKVINRKEVVKQLDATNFGAFTVFPVTSVVAAGAKNQITVEFHSESPGSFEEIVAIDISDRSPNDYLDVIEYRLVGETCVPGINTSEYTSIFEEQTVCKRLELFNMQSNVYAEEDRVFYFGAFLAGQQTQVRFKLSNPYKVACDISIATKPKSKTKSDAADFAFDVEPKKLSIPAHEHRYVTAFFHPTSIQSYAGIFEVTVENVDQSKSKPLLFELRGEGTLPRRLMVGTAQVLPIVLKNEGITNAKVKLEWATREQDEFECMGINTYYSLRPQESCSIDVKCRGLGVRKFECELKVRVVDNSFEDTTIQLSGEGYVDDLTFDELPLDTGENELSFGDCFIGETKMSAFTVSNHSSDLMRINWAPESLDFIFSPSVLHIHPKSTKSISVSFCAKQQLELKQLKAFCKAVRIKYINPILDVDWDDRAKAVRWISVDSQSPRKVIDQYPEPQHEVLPGASPERYLLLSANADYSAYECDVSNVKFKSTLMFQSRVYKFTVKNPGRVVVKYNFALYGENGQQLEPSSDECPFSVTPAFGCIDPGESAILTVTFSPLDDGIFSSLLVGSIQNLPKDSKQISIKLAGAGLRPFCHFELGDSDYITSERRNVEVGNIANGVPLNLPPQTKVIEFESCGVKVRNTRRFYIVNPTDFDYEFQWTTDSSADKRVFRCATPRGTVLSNKKFEMIFEFIPETISLKESFWKFEIIEHGIVIPFLLVGQALEPNVYFDRVSVNFKSLLVGRQVKETVQLVNNEDIPFAFNFNETSFELGADQVPVVRFSPTSGTIGGHSEVPIEIIFTPSTEKMFNFNLQCSIKKKPTPVSINVKGEGYEIHDVVQSELVDGTIFELASGANSENALDFGQVQINEKRVKRVTITNSGKFNLDFSWKFTSKLSGMISVVPEIGTVPKGEKLLCEVSFIPTSNVVLKNVKAMCQIVNGRSYPLTIHGSGCKPLLKFSAVAHDFGPHFIYRPGMTAATTRIRITNQDSRDISIDPVSKDLGVFDIRKVPGTLTPGESTDMEIAFYPKEAKAYNEIIRVEINGLSFVNFNVMGVGAEFRVDVVQPDTKHINFGSIRVGHTVAKTIKLINKSVIAAKFNLGPSSVIEMLANRSVTLSQTDDIILRPKGVATVEFKFMPQARISPFAEEIVMEGPGVSKPLFLVSGMCIPQPVQNDVIKFSSPVRQADIKSIKIENKTSTLWHIRPVIENESWTGADFIDIEPNQTKLYDLSFTPFEMTGSGDGGRHEGSVFFPLPDGSGLLYKLNGIADKPSAVATITREVPCKTSFTEILSITNWLKRPQRFRVTTESAKTDPSTLLKGLDFIDVPGLATRDYKMNYYAYKEGMMSAKVVFKNEQTQEFLFYNLVIKSTPPGVISTLDITTSVRQLCMREIVISNPVPTPVTFNAVCSHADVNASHTFTIPPKSDGVCLIEFLPLQPKECTTRLTITSAELGVYQYDLKLVATAAAPERSLHFKVGLGGTQTQTLRFMSFAKAKTEYLCRVDSPDFAVEKSVIAPSASVGGVEVCIEVAYEPSKLGDIRTQLLVTSANGGDYVCPLYGHCTNPRPQGPITIKIGATASVAFKNVFTNPAAFNFVVDNPAFTVKAQETIPSKKAIQMIITAVAPPANALVTPDSKAAKVGKLMVTHKGTNITWVYYLRL